MKSFESRVYENKDGKYVHTPSLSILNARDIEHCRFLLRFSAPLFVDQYPRGFIFVTTEIKCGESKQS